MRMGKWVPIFSTHDPPPSLELKKAANQYMMQDIEKIVINTDVKMEV
jgi:hypothetical protein